jgi:hypothetical protein
MAMVDVCGLLSTVGWDDEDHAQPRMGELGELGEFSVASVCGNAVCVQHAQNYDLSVVINIPNCPISPNATLTGIRSDMFVAGHTTAQPF